MDTKFPSLILKSLRLVSESLEKISLNQMTLSEHVMETIDNQKQISLAILSLDRQDTIINREKIKKIAGVK